MSLKITKEALMDNISEIPEEFVIEAEYTEEELKRLGTPAEGKSAAGAVIVTETPKKKEKLVKEASSKAEEEDDIEPQPEAAPKKAATILWITMGVTLAAAAILLFVLFWNPDRRDVVTTTEAIEERLDKIKKAEVGEYITLGSYEQDNKTKNGQESIEWLVLDKSGNRMLVISRYGLDCKRYNEAKTDITWEACSLRKWLNGAFYENAFEAEEKSIIMASTVAADKVFLLSKDEVDRYFDSEDARKCTGTAYCFSQGAYDGVNGTCAWWLRTPAYSYRAEAVFVDGRYLTDPVDQPLRAVRPAIWLYLGTDENKEEITTASETTAEMVADTTAEETTTEEATTAAETTAPETTEAETTAETAEETTAAPETPAAVKVELSNENFPDDAFRNHLSKYCDKDRDGYLNEEEIAEITSLDFDYATVGDAVTIHSLKGLEYLTDLRVLICSGQDLAELDVSRNKALRQLECGSSTLTELDVSQNNELRVLDCSRNELTKLDVSRNTALTRLDCSSNDLLELDVSQNTALTKLECGSNSLTVLDLSANAKLTKLDFSANLLDGVDLSSNTAIEDINISFNNYTVFDLSILPNLKKLYCVNSYMTEIDLSKNTKLEEVDLVFTNLTKLDLSNSTSLTRLNCYGNSELTSLDVSGCSRLTYIDCHDSPLTTLNTDGCERLTEIHTTGD